MADANELKRLNDRSRDIFRRIVESYLTTGEPVGSRNLSRVLPNTLSPASIRNVMSDLEHLGLIFAPHTSAGRMPTQHGLRLFVDGLLEVGELSPDERKDIEAQIKVRQQGSMEQVLNEAGEMISGLSHCAGVVLAEKMVGRLKHIEFVSLEPGRALVVLVGEDSNVENRVISIPPGLPPSSLIEAANYLNARIRGLSIGEARARIEQELAGERVHGAALDFDVDAPAGGVDAELGERVLHAAQLAVEGLEGEQDFRGGDFVAAELVEGAEGDDLGEAVLFASGDQALPLPRLELTFGDPEMSEERGPGQRLPGAGGGCGHGGDSSRNLQRAGTVRWRRCQRRRRRRTPGRWRW